MGGISLQNNQKIRGENEQKQADRQHTMTMIPPSTAQRMQMKSTMMATAMARRMTDDDDAGGGTDG